MSSVTPIDQQEKSSPEWDLDDPALYLNRELTWLAFNRRVLAEAEKERNPLLERVKFLAIFDSNLDEFFMKRIGGLKQQVGAKVDIVTVDGRTPRQQIEDCVEHVAEALADRAYVKKELLESLASAGVRIVAYEDLDKRSRKFVRKDFKKHVMPTVTPLAIDEAHPFPFISNLSINLLLRVYDPAEDDPHLIRIKVPATDQTPRFMRVEDSDTYVPMEEIIAGNLDLLLPGAEILSVGYFRVTRNAIVERNQEKANDLLEMMEAELRDRRFAPVVRLEVSPDLGKEMRKYLAKELRLTGPEDLYVVSDLLGARDLMQFMDLDRPDLKNPPFEPATHPRLSGSGSIFTELRNNGPLLVMHPYHSFDQSVTRLLREAARDPDVLAIKTTVYRTSADSPILQLLVDAVTKGKQVAVVVELQARFDEAANIHWANQLEEAGIHVSYGVVGYKTHAKAVLILRKESSGALKRYMHIGTGNYNPVTAKQYADIGLMISDPATGKDGTELFNLLTSGSLTGRKYNKLLISPREMKAALLRKIQEETRLHRSDGKGHIQLKTNALEDPDIIRALYEAARDGVKIDLIVRDTCRFRPGLPGLSENVRVISVIGRFLEHARVYYFRNGGEDDFYIGSADLMTRNLEARVEVLAPIEEPDLKAELREVLDLQLNCRLGAWQMDANGVYRMLSSDDDSLHSQTAMMQAISSRSRRSEEKTDEFRILT